MKKNGRGRASQGKDLLAVLGRGKLCVGSRVDIEALLNERAVNGGVGGVVCVYTLVSGHLKTTVLPK